MKIEKNIPIPDRDMSGLGRKTKYPFLDMEVGDSIFDDSADKIGKSKAYPAANTWGKRRGIKFAARQVDGGVRIWRVE